jgi:lipoprotein signal peptidase|tara:strand:+ start:238 stop:423 length:186 start_codon:yes stop_codon:yes gene_type:complete
MISLLEKQILKTVIAEYLEEIELGNITDRDFIEFIVDYIETIANEKAIELLNEITRINNED